MNRRINTKWQVLGLWIPIWTLSEAYICLMLHILTTPSKVTSPLATEWWSFYLANFTTAHIYVYHISAQGCTCARESTNKRPHPLIYSRWWHARICQGVGPKHLGASCLKGSWGQLSKSTMLVSKLLTPGPKPLLWSVLVLGRLIKITFIPKPNLRV